jgi:pimeloyl-ACP methyl ester carboxylesterase
MKFTSLMLPIGSLLMMLHSASHAQDGISPRRPAVPPFECQARVGYDRDMMLPGYLLPTSAGPKTCIPFTTALFQPPAGYKGDYYVDEFTDEKLRQRWEDCKKDKECHARVYDQVQKRHPPNKEFGLTDPKKRYLLGKIEEKGENTDLTTVRRPGFFARAPYNEPIAAIDDKTYIVEFTGPADTYERLRKNMNDEVKIRGWYLRGEGVDDGKGGKKRAVIVLSGGGGDRIAAIDDPADVAYVIDPKTGEAIPDDDWPSERSGAKGPLAWRKMYFRLQQAGFDVIALDRRGIGISGGFSDTNTLQQGRDLVDIAAALSSGKGVRVLSPTGELTKGKAAIASLRGDAVKYDPPVLFMGSSRGTMASSWAMAINFDKDCTYDEPKIACKPARQVPAVKGVIMLAEFSSGAGYIPAQTTPKDDGRGPGRDRALFTGGTEVENNLVFFPSSAPLASVSKWPSAFYARGLWCYADGLEGSIDSYSRVKGDLKDLVVVRGPHPYETWPDSEKTRVQNSIIAYGRAVVFGEKTIPGRRAWTNMKDLVGTTSDVWEASTKPSVQP